MGFPIVNTPFAPDSAAARASSLLQQWWNSAPSDDGRELPPYPRHYPGPWLGPLSFIARHSPVGPPDTVRPVGTFTAVSRGEATNNMSQFRCNHLRQRRVLLKRPAGLSITVDNPMGRSHHPRAFTPSFQQRYEGNKLTIPCSSLSLTRSPFRRQDTAALFVDVAGLTWASYLAAGHVSDTLVTRGPSAVLGRARQWFHRLRELFLLCK
jgi:hypothetical protein